MGEWHTGPVGIVEGADLFQRARTALAVSPRTASLTWEALVIELCDEVARLAAVETERAEDEAVQERVRQEYLAAARKAVAERDEARQTIEAIRANALAWHGPPGDSGHERALAVIATWCEEGVPEKVLAALAPVAARPETDAR